MDRLTFNKSGPVQFVWQRDPRPDDITADTIFGGQMDRRVIAPYVRESRLPDLETSTRVADQALLFFQSLRAQYDNQVHPGACVGLALYQSQLDTEQRIAKLAAMSGRTMDGFLRLLSQTRALLDLPFAISFDQLAEDARLPVRFASTARKVLSDLQAEFPEDGRVSRAAVHAAVMLVVAVKHGVKKAEVLSDLARITLSDPEDVLRCEQMIRDLLGRKHGLAPAHRAPRPPGHASEELKAVAAQAIAQLAERGGGKKVQQKLSFALVPRREPD
jgi:hypothetical protein